MNNIEPIFRFLKERLGQGQSVALVTLTAVTGASTRNPGAHMAVAADESFVGSFSGGCVESAVVAGALDALQDGKPREVRFGAGSPYMDIKLPCGGGIDLLINPIIEPEMVAATYDTIVDRQPFSICIDTVSGSMNLTEEEMGDPVFQDGDKVIISHLPSAKIAILGHGASVEHLAKLSGSYGISYDVYTPDQVTIDAITAIGGHAIHLKTPNQHPRFKPDTWTACAFLFHDHDWESQLMFQALSSPAFYVGAMGSYKTHDHRKELLHNIGVTDEQIAKMDAPIGVIPSTRDPATLALSTLTQIVERYHHKFDRHRPR